jgi:hypothetical protein
MTQLPATFAEAQASHGFAIARDWIAWQREPDGLLHPNATMVWGTTFMKRYAQSHPFGADEIVYYAENGCKQAVLALDEVIAERIDRGEHPGAVLGGYLIRLRNPRRPRKHGAGRAENFIRDMAVWFLVETLIRKCGLSQTRACQIAATALTEARLGIPLGWKAVQRIFDRYLPAFAGESIAAGTKWAAGLPPGYPGIFGL